MSATMNMTTKKSTSLLLAGLLVLINLTPAYAGIVGTPDLLDEQRLLAERQTIITALQREEVQALLIQRGIDPSQATQRIQQLTAVEVEQLAQHIDQLPQGAGAAEVILIIFLVFLFTELTGITDIFPGIDPVR